MKILVPIIIIVLALTYSCANKDFSFKKKDFKELKTLQIHYYERITSHDKVNFNIVDPTVINAISEQLSTHNEEDFIHHFSGMDTKRIYETIIKQDDKAYKLIVGFVDVVTDQETWVQTKEDRGFAKIYIIKNNGGTWKVGTFYDDELLKLFDSQNPLFKKKLK